MREIQQQQEADTKALLVALADLKNSMALMSAAPSSVSLVDVESPRPPLTHRRTSSNRRFSNNNTIPESSNESGSQDDHERLGRQLLIQRALGPRQYSRSPSPRVELQGLAESPFDESEPSSPAVGTENDERGQADSEAMNKHERHQSFASEYDATMRDPGKRTLDHYNKSITQCLASAAELRTKESYTRAAERMKKAMEHAAAREKWYNVPYPEVEMQNSLAEIYLDQNNFPEALEIWESLVRGKPLKDGKLTMVDVKHYYYISKTYFESWKGNKEPNNIKSADINGEIAFTHRQELKSDPSHPTLSEIAELMASISHRMSEPDEAIVYRTYIDQKEEKDVGRSKAGSIRAPEMIKSASARSQNSVNEPGPEAELAPGKDATKALAKAILSSDVHRALRLLDVHGDKIDVERRFQGGITPLMIAFETCRDKSVIETLLARNADINTPDSSGRTVLHRSSGDGDVDMVKLAIKLDAKIDARDKQDFTPLMYCVYMNPKHSDEVVKVLAQNETSKADVEASTVDQSFTALHFAARNCARLGSSLTHRQSPSSPSRLGTSSPGGAAPTVFDPDYKLRAMTLMRNLVSDYSAHVDPVDVKGFTPLCTVCEAGYFPAVELLLDLGASPNHATRAKTTPLYLATNNQSATEDYIKTAWVLVDAGADTGENANLPSKWKNEFKSLVEEECRRRQAPQQLNGGGGLVRQDTELTINKIKGKGRKRATSDMGSTGGGSSSRINSLGSLASVKTNASGSSSWSQKLGISKSR
jgi:ankyrin repeat protein